MEQLFKDLLFSENENEVIKVLKKYNLWDLKSNIDDWKYFGNDGSNYSTVSNQTTSPYGALVEKLVNGIDANLILESKKMGINPESKNAPQTIPEATEKFFGIKEGRLRSLSNKELEEISQRNMLVATGARDNPAFMIIDRGEGQAPNNLEDTLLSLNKGNKQKIKFVQGLHNQGGTAVVRHLGKYGFQLIASKRHPYLLEKNDNEQWGFTLTRRAYPEERGGEYRSSVLLYLAPEGKIPILKSKTIPVLPNKEFKAYKQKLEQGTMIKLFDYKIKQKSKITLHLRRQLNFILLASPLPIKIIDTRDYGGGSPSDRILGLWNVKEDQFIDGIQYGKLDVPGIGLLNYKYGVFESRKTTKKESGQENTVQAKAEFNSGAYFTLNGQTHGDIPNAFIRRKCKLDELEDNLLIDIDISTVPTQVRENLTKADRQNSSEGEERDAIDKFLIPQIRDNPFLKRLNAEIKKEKLKKAVESNETFEKLFQDLLKNSIDFENILRNLQGQKFLFKKTMPEKIGEEEQPVLEYFPTFFEFDNNKNTFSKNVPINNNPEVQLITNARNDYFERISDESPGKIEYINNNSITIVSSYLSNGRFYIKLKLPENAKVGEELELGINITDDNQGSLGKEGFKNTLKIIVGKETKKSGGKRSTQKNRKSGNGKKSTPTADLPKVIPFHLKDREDWTPLTSVEYNEVEKSWHGNKDNKFLKHFISLDPENALLIEHWFFYGLLLTGLGLIQDGQKQEDINKALRGNAAHIITVIELYKMKNLL